MYNASCVCVCICSGWKQSYRCSASEYHYQSLLSVTLPGCLPFSRTQMSVRLKVPLLQNVASHLRNFQSSNFLWFSDNCHFNSSVQKLLLHPFKNTRKFYKPKGPIRKENMEMGYKTPCLWNEDHLWLLGTARLQKVVIPCLLLEFSFVIFC